MTATVSTFRTPGCNLPKGRFSDVREDVVLEWLETLPRGHPESCARQLLDTLSEANRAPLQRLSRYALTELLRPTAYAMVDSLARHYVSQPLPLDERQQEHAALVQSLLAELATGFKLAANTLLQQKRLGRDGRITLQLSTQRALLAHGRELLETYRIHAPEPVNLWGDLHRLYRNAEALKLQAMPVEGTRDSEETLLSIRQAYLRLAILALANPYHLLQDEAQELYRRIGRWIHFARLMEVSSGESLEGCFVTDLDSDLPPRYISQQQRGIPPTNPRRLDVAGIVEVLDQQIRRLEESLATGTRGGMLSERLHFDMYSRFRHALGGRQERAAPRSPTVSRLQLVSGLRACHYLFNDQVVFNPAEDEQRWKQKVSGLAVQPADKALSLAGRDSYLNDAGKTPPPGHRARFEAHDREADDVWQRVNRLGDGSVDAPTDETQSADCKPEVWSRKNTSNGGMALFCPRNSRTRSKVGELIAWADGSGPGVATGEHWSLGVVRWLRTRSHGGLELGVQQLAESAHAVGVRAVRGTGQSAGYVRGLITPRVNPMQKESSLVVPSGLYGTDTLLALNLGSLLIYAQLVEALETTGLFTRFRFRLSQAPLPR